MPENASAAVQVPTSDRIAALSFRCSTIENEEVTRLLEDVVSVVSALDVSGSLSHSRVVDLIESDLDIDRKEGNFIPLLESAGIIEGHRSSYELGPAFD